MRSELDTTDLLFPTLSVKNKKGDLIFSMKRKGEKYGQLYYLFEIHWDRMDADEIAKVNTVWFLTKQIAAMMDIPLYDINEVTSEMEKRVKDVPLGKTVDVSIPILDHATGKVHSLVIGITKKPSKGSW